VEHRWVKAYSRPVFVDVREPCGVEEQVETPLGVLEARLGEHLILRDGRGEKWVVTEQWFHDSYAVKPEDVPVTPKLDEESVYSVQPPRLRRVSHYSYQFMATWWAVLRLGFHPFYVWELRQLLEEHGVVISSNKIKPVLTRLVKAGYLKAVGVNRFGRRWHKYYPTGMLLEYLRDFWGEKT